MSRHNRTTVEKRPDNSGALTIQEQEIDTPILPVEQMERLHAFKPEAIDWLLEETSKEAEDRRKRQARIDWFVFWERFCGQFFGLLIGIAGVVGGVFAAIKGFPGAGGTIATVSIGTLAVAFIGKLKEK